MDNLKALGAIALPIIIITVLIFVLSNKQPNSSVPENPVSSEVANTTNKEEGPVNKGPETVIKEGVSYLATLKTSEGDITIQLSKDTPVTTNNFVYLAKSGFYSNTIFHRVIKGFMIQGGDPKGNGTGGPGYTFDDEDFVGSYDRGVVAMANSGPDTNGSQFFIMHQSYPLPKNYVIFGKVINGLEVVDKIADKEVTANASGEPSRPVTPVTVNSVTIEEAKN